MMVGCPKYSSSHNVADLCQQLLFNHGVNLIQAKYLHRMLQHHHPLINLNLVFLKNGLFFRQVYENFVNMYNMNIYDNKIDCVKSRINYVQAHEDHSRVF